MQRIVLSMMPQTMMDNGFTRPAIFFDRTPLSQLPLEIAEVLENRQLYSRGDNKKSSFVGVLLTDTRAAVFLPRSSELIQPDQELIFASRILKSVDLYGKNSETRVDSNDDGDGRTGLTQLSLIFLLLDDFRQNGIYSQRNSICNVNRGRADWARTIKRVKPYPNKSGQPIYLDYYGIENQYFSTCEVAAIHAGVIRELEKKFSWLLTGAEHPIAAELRGYSRPHPEPIARLKKELTTAYSDRDIRLLKALIKYLEVDSGSECASFLAGLENFHFCWEHMLGKVLKYNKTSQYNKILPAPVYIDIHGNNLNADNKSMRADIILHDDAGGRCTVADAKYYSATSQRDAPGWGDIVKQLFYEKALNELGEIECDVKNAFIFPGVNGLLSTVKIRDRTVGISKKTVFLDSFKPIYCYYIDPMEVVKCYVEGRVMKDLTEALLD